ncbi:hypothetical protein [Oceanobacillus timonensis]|uniref:hypothetical protein n=1 Tax=Oceanobacillus timonensis TaxID=1926285 RepID=UPI0009BC157F|nr:hypothetical protein [Oceanobacillus timonensis]
MSLNKLTEKDFAVLRAPFESRRQSPHSFGSIFILSIFLQSLMFFLAYVVVADKSNYPLQKEMFTIHLIITVIIILISIVYAIPAVYMKKQKSQYVISVIISQNLFGAFPYVFTLFIAGRSNSTENSLMIMTLVTFVIGLFIFVFTCVRFYNLLQKGNYRKDSRKDKLRGRFETQSYLPFAIIGGVGIVYIIQYIARNFYFLQLDLILIAIICLTIFYTMLFVLPEQLVILYCKYRFDSFNYDEDGNLKPMGMDRKERRNEESSRSY